MKILWFVALWVTTTSIALAQEWQGVPDSSDTDLALKESKIVFNGYLKNLQSLQFDKDFRKLGANNIIHNRMNVKWKPFNELQLATEFRNRLIWGDDVRNFPNYSELLRNPNERVNLSSVWFSNNSMIMHTNIDRLYINYTHKNLTARFGRQRINWGITTTWNPNDLFNTFNFLDFDYEERPGSDAIKITGEFGNFSGAEIAYAPGNTKQSGVMAIKYHFNSNGYDVQAITGLYNKRFTAGIGWAGNIKDAGFKGELQYFASSGTEKSQINVVMESDYVFAGNWYLNGAILFNNTGLNSKISHPAQITFNFSPANLMPTKWNFMITTAKEITPLFSSTFAILYAPGTNLMLILPGLRYNLAQNIDMDIVWQSFFIQLNHFQGIDHRGFLRLKYSF